METRKVGDIVLSFNKTINSLISKLEKRSSTSLELANCDRLRQRINLLRKTLGGRELLNEAGPFLYKYSEKILARDESFFMRISIAEAYGREISKEDEFVYNLTDSIKSMYNKAKAKEKDIVYSEILSLHTDYLEYCIALDVPPTNPRESA